MLGPRRSSPARRLLYVVFGFAVATAQGCGSRVVDAVEMGPPLVWPNEQSSANSDPWLVTHHPMISEMRPRVLLLHFYNGSSADQARQTADSQIAALRESSRYHGYSDAAAPPFLDYEVVKTVDLTDHPAPPKWPYVSSTLLPTTPDGAFDNAALFTPAFADRYGFDDPDQPSRHLTLCELFERGVINELWLHVGEDAPRAPGLMMERKQVYDASGHAVPGSFEPCAGYGCLPESTCAVTVRIAHLSPNRGPGCDLQVRTFGIENMRSALPYLQTNATPFMNRDFKERFHTRFDGWDDICDKAAPVGTPCVTYPSPRAATGTYADGSSWTIDPFVQGCGTSQFPPNATARWDYANSTPVDSRCEHFGLRDGPAGQDLREPYASNKVSAYDWRFTGCGGGWQVYLRQSIPGWNNAAFAVDGTPMKNWWPFLFY